MSSPKGTPKTVSKWLASRTFAEAERLVLSVQDVSGLRVVSDWTATQVQTDESVASNALDCAQTDCDGRGVGTTYLLRHVDENGADRASTVLRLKPASGLDEGDVQSNDSTATVQVLTRMTLELHRELLKSRAQESTAVQQLLNMMAERVRVLEGERARMADETIGLQKALVSTGATETESRVRIQEKLLKLAEEYGPLVLDIVTRGNGAPT